VHLVRRAGLTQECVLVVQFDDPRDAVLGEKAAQVRARKRAAAGVPSNVLYCALAGPYKH